MFETKFVDKNKAQVLWSIFFFVRKSCRLWDNVEKHGRAGQATDDNITRCMHIACWVIKVTDTHTHTEYIILNKVLLPTDAQENFFKRSIKIYIKTASTCFGVITIIRERTIWAC